MMTVYVPTTRKSQNLGHGEGSVMFNVWSEQGVYGERKHAPIFTTRQSCEEWIKNQDKFTHYTITEAELLP